MRNRSLRIVLNKNCYTIRIADSHYRLTVMYYYYAVETDSLTLTNAVLPAKIQNIMKNIT
jgi:hypothetical protein